MEFDNGHASSSADGKANHNASDAGESAEGQHGHDTAKEQERVGHASRPPGHPRRKREVAKWPDDQIVVTGLTEKGMPTEKKAVRRMTKLAGLIARQRLSLTMRSFNDLTEDDKKNLFDECVLPTLEFEESFREKACHTMMIMVSHSWRTFKSDLVRHFVRKGLNAREKHPFIKDQEWNEFVKIQLSEEAKQKSEKFRKIRAMNKLDHCLGTTSYDGAAEKWEEEDKEFAAQGITNPWHRFPEGRSRGFLRGHAKLVKTSEGSTKIQWVSKLAEKVFEQVVEKQAELESLGLSNTWVRDKDVLAQVLGLERTGRVRGVSDYFGWKHWPDCSNMYRKRKRSDVDVDALRDELRAEVSKEVRVEVTKDIIAMLRENGVNLPLLYDTLHPVGAKYNSCASASDAVCNNSQLDGHGGISYHVDLVTEPIDCALVSNLGGFQVKVASGQVFPQETELNSVPVQDGYVVVHVDFVVQDHESLLLTPPTSSEVKTLGEALFHSIQWRKGDIVLSPKEVPNASSLKTTRLGASPTKTSVKDLLYNVSSSQDEKAQSALTTGNCASKDHVEGNKQTNKSTHGTPGSRSAGAPKSNTKRGQLVSVKQQQQQQQQQHAEPATCGRAPKSNTKRPQQMGVKQQQEHAEAAKLSTAILDFEFGKPMLSAEELGFAGPGRAALHAYYMNACAENKNTGIIACVPQNYFLLDRKFELLNLRYEGLFDLLKLHALDLGIIRVLTLMNISTARQRCVPVGFLDPGTLSLAALQRDRDFSVCYLESCLKEYDEHLRCRCLMFAYNCRGHSITIIIVPIWNKVFYPDSNRGKKTDVSQLQSVIDEAYKKFQKDMNQGQPGLRKLVHAIKILCLQQRMGNISGFFVAHNMLSMMVQASKEVFNAEDLDFTIEGNFTLDAVAEKICKFILKEITSSDGLFHHDD